MPYIALPHFVGNPYLPTGSAFFISVTNSDASNSRVVNVFAFVDDTFTAGALINSQKIFGTAYCGLTFGMAVGGSSSGTFLSATSRFNVSAGTWAASTNPLTTASRTAGAFGNNTFAWFLGGNNGGALTFTNRFNLLDQTRITGPAMSAGRLRPICFSNGVKGWAWGGGTATPIGVLALDRYDITAATQTTLSTTINNRTYGAAFTSPTHGHAVCGFTTQLAGSATNFATKLQYSDETQTTTGAVTGTGDRFSQGASNHLRGMCTGATIGAGATVKNLYPFSTETITAGTALSTTNLESAVMSSRPGWM
jgi:hypothetical protein